MTRGDRERRDGARTWPFYRPDTIHRVSDLLSAGRGYASGRDPEIERFQADFAARHRPDGQALFFGSGTAALLAAYFALDLSPGAEVLVPTNTFRATVTPLLPLGLHPVLCDADPLTGNLDLQDAARRVTSRTEAVVATHLWGHPVDLAALREFAQRHGLALVEDASHAHGSHWDGVPVGTCAEVAVFSTGTKKMVSGGMGGVLVTSSPELLERAAVLGHPKAVAKHAARSSAVAEMADVGMGFNLRGTPIAAVLAAEHLDRLETTISVKNENIDLLARAVGECLPALRMPLRDDRFDHGSFYAVRARWTDPAVPASRVRELMVREGVPVERQGRPLHQHRSLGKGVPGRTPPAARSAVRPQGRDDTETLPNADALFEAVIGWDTRELYEPAAEVIRTWRAGLLRVAEALESVSR